MPLVQQFQGTTAIVGSPAAAAETVVAQLNLGSVDFEVRQVYLRGWCQFTVGTTGNLATLRIRRTGLTGTNVSPAANAGLTMVAANVVAPDLETVDAPGDSAGLVYVLTLQVGAATAASTVSAVGLIANLMQ